MLPRTGLQDGFQLVFGDPDLAEAGIVRLDFILESNQDEMYDGFSEIYTGEVDEYYSSQILAGQQETVEYYDSDPIPDELSNFAEVKTSLYRIHEHIIDVVTFAELSQSQSAELKLRDGDDYIWETQQKLNVFHDSLPRMSGRLKDQRETSLAHLFLVLVPNGVPVTYSEDGFD